MAEFCGLCLEEIINDENLIKLFDDDKDSAKMLAIINQHITCFELTPSDECPKNICTHCWNVINEFHSLYMKVDAAQRELKENFVKFDIIDNIKEEITENETFDSTVNDESFTGNDDGNFDDNESYDENASFQAPKESKIKVKTRVRDINKPTDNPSRNQKRTERLDVQKKIVEFFDLCCKECSVTFPTFRTLARHQRSVHNHKVGFIYCCNKKLNRQAKLLEHLNWHLNPESFRCNICQRSYSEQYNLRLHMKSHTPETKTFECDVCSKKFFRKARLSRHLLVVHVTKHTTNHKCDECGKSFVLNSILQAHIRRVHQKLYRHICDICAKEFNSKDQYQRHRLQHIEAGPKVVCFCGARLKTVGGLKSHIKRSHENTPQTCGECGKIAPNITALRSHIRYNHRLLRKFHCTVCSKSFKREIILKEHMASHLGITLYTCPYCPQQFNKNSNMHAHRKTKHYEEWIRDRLNRVD